MGLKKMLRNVMITVLCLIIIIPAASAWEMERPWDDVEVPYESRRVENNSFDSSTQVGVGVEVCDYSENDGVYSRDGVQRDVVPLKIVATANTRELIRYDVGSGTGFPWYDEDYLGNPFANTGIVGDDVAAYVNFGDRFRFYGGPGSAEYTGAWVCSNGFISFQGESTQATPDYGTENEPNAIVAPFWTDLAIDAGTGAIRYGLVYLYGHLHFCITWENARIRSNGAIVTFQVLLELEMYTYSRMFRQSDIYFTYREITDDLTVDPPPTYHIENQYGTVHTSWRTRVSTGETLVFYQSSNSAYIRRLIIEIDKFNDVDTSVDIIDEPEDWMRGHNVKFRPEHENDNERRFLTALNGVYVLLLGFAVPYFGIMYGVTAITVNLVNVFAFGQQQAEPLDVSDSWGEGGWRNVDCAEIEAQTLGWWPATCVDATFGIQAYWILNDQNNEEHSIRVKATVEYYVVTPTGEVVAARGVDTSVDLKVSTEIGNYFGTAGSLTWESTTFEKSATSLAYLGNQDHDDYYKFSANADDEISVEMIPPYQSNEYANFDIYLYDPSGVEVANSTLGPGVTDSIEYTATSSGTWYISVHRVYHRGLYQLHAKVKFSGGYGGGCVAEGTLVTMVDGSAKPVEKIKVGDQVLGFDPSTGSYATENVLAVTKTKVELLENINDGALRLTPTDQPIYIRNSTFEGWLQDPEKIEVDWEIFDAETRIWVAVTSITYEEEKTWAYDFTTDGYQTYLANSYLLMDKLGRRK